MLDQKLSALQTGGPIADGDLLYFAQSGAPVKQSALTLKNYTNTVTVDIAAAPSAEFAFVQSPVGIDSNLVNNWTGSLGFASFVGNGATNAVFGSYNNAHQGGSATLYLTRTRSLDGSPSVPVQINDTVASFVALGSVGGVPGGQWWNVGGIDIGVDPKSPDPALGNIHGVIGLWVSDVSTISGYNLRIDLNGAVWLDTSTPSPGNLLLTSVGVHSDVPNYINSNVKLVLIANMGASESCANIVTFGNGSYGTEIAFGKTRSSTGADAGTPVVPGDEIFSLYGVGSDGTHYVGSVGSLNVTVDPLGTVSAGHVPGQLTLATSPGSGSDIDRLILDSKGNVLIGLAAIATTATDGFFYLESCAGAPTGVPTSYTGRAPIVIDTSTGTGKLWVRIGATWRGVALA